MVVPTVNKCQRLTRKYFFCQTHHTLRSQWKYLHTINENIGSHSIWENFENPDCFVINNKQSKSDSGEMTNTIPQKRND